MAKNVTRTDTTAHPTWCRHEQSKNHDPHKSAPERVAEDFPSDLVIEAYLLRLQRPFGDRSKATLAALEFHEPGEEPAQFLLTFDQLRHLSHSLTRLVATEEGLATRTATGPN